MRKGVLRLLCTNLAVFVATSFFAAGIVSADNSAGDLSLSIEFAETFYIAGETATANIYITDGAEEANEDISVVDLRINFDKSTMSFVEDSGEFNSAFPQEVGQCTKQVKLSPGETDVVSVMYIKDSNGSASPNAPTLTSLSGKYEEALADTDKIYVASLKFKINESASAEKLKIKFRKYFTDTDTTNRYPGCIMNDNSERYTLNIDYDEVYTADLSKRKARIKNYLGYELDNEGFIKVGPEVFVNNDDGAVLIIKFYNTQTGVLVAPVVVKELNDGENKFSGDDAVNVEIFGNCSPYNLKIKYYVWDSTTAMRPLCDTVNTL